MKEPDSLDNAGDNYQMLSRNMTSGLALHKIITDDLGEPVDYLFIEVNPAFEKLTGLKRKDVINRTVLEVLPQTEEYWIKKFGYVALTGKPLNYNNYSKSFDKFFKTRVYSPQTGYFVVIIDDITFQKKAEEILKKNEAQLNAVFNNTHTIFLVIDKERNIVRINKKGAEIQNITAVELVDKKPGFAINCLNQNEGKFVCGTGESCNQCTLNTLIEQTFKQQKGSQNLKILHPIKVRNKIENRLLLVSSEYLAGLDNPLILLTIEDITQKKKIEEQLLEHQLLLQEKNIEYETINQQLREANEVQERINKELKLKNQELQTKNQLLEEAKIKAEESDRLKTSFLSNITHEIRTPLNGIVGFSSLLRSKNKEKTDLYIDIIQNSSDQLISVINDILDLSKIETGAEKLEKNELLLQELLQNIYNQFSILINKENVEFKLEQPPTDFVLFTDKIKLVQIFHNLIGNAIKFTEKGRISFGYNFENNELTFFVSDTGIGIDKKHHKTIFKPFRQIDESSTRKYGGNGIGLSLANAYVNMMGGELRVQSQLGKGATFTFSLPDYEKIDQGKKTMNPLQELFIPDWSDKTIMIVDDDLLSRKLLTETLEITNCLVLEAADGNEAIKLLKTNPGIDTILLDIKMPKMDGYETLKGIRKINNKIPVIAQTAFASEKEYIKKLTTDFDAFLAKPLKIAKIYNAIQQQFDTTNSV